MQTLRARLKKIAERVHGGLIKSFRDPTLRADLDHVRGLLVDAEALDRLLGEPDGVTADTLKSERTPASSKPYELRVFASPLARIVRIDVEVDGHALSGGWSPEQARVLAAFLVGAADVAENTMTTEAALAFLTHGGGPEKPS